MTIKEAWHWLVHGDEQEKETEFLPAILEVTETPPSPVGRMVMMSILALLVVTLLWSILGHINEVAVATGKVIPSGQAKTVQVKNKGIIKEILVKEGQDVDEGDVLVRLDPTTPRADFDSLKKRAAFYRLDIARLEAELSGKPLVVHVHATSFDRGTDDMVDSRVYSIEKRGMEAADRVVTVSDLTRNIVINKYGIDPAKVVTVHNAVDFSGRENLQVDRGVRDKVVTFLGRITFQKGPEYFIEAAAKVLKRTKNVRFVMAGSGDMMNRAIRQVARLGISDRFHFTGFLRGQEVQKMFALSDVYIMPSVSEPFGISPLEAMRSNVPSIISHQSGAAEVLKYALKVDFWDVDAMADDIYALLQYPALSDFANRQGFDEVNALKWNNATLKLKKVYESVVNS